MSAVIWPDQYLLMKDYGGASRATQNYANLCWYCHENMFNINGEGSPTGMGRFKFYQGKAVFEASSHNTSTPLLEGHNRGPSADLAEAEQDLPAGNKGCLPQLPYAARHKGALTRPAL